MTDLDRAAVFGAEAWEKAGSGQLLTPQESKTVLRTIGNQIARNATERAATDRELIPA